MVKVTCHKEEDFFGGWLWKTFGEIEGRDVLDVGTAALAVRRPSWGPRDFLSPLLGLLGRCPTIYSKYAMGSILVENSITVPQLELVLYEFAGLPATISHARSWGFSAKPK